jgi:S-formylglutathione hydrolase FrmB
MGAVAALVLALTLPVGAAGIVEYGLEAPSPTLGHPIPYALYRPFPSAAQGERWPVVYLLHGLTGKDGDWFTWGNLGPILDQAIADGRIPPLVVVAPGLADSWYVDSPDPGGFGKVDTAIATDLVAAIDAKLPTAACRKGRAIGGNSMGGWGAVLQAINHPDTYVAALSFSGALHEPLTRGDPRSGWIPGLFRNVFGTPFSEARFNAANPFNRVRSLITMTKRPAFYLTVGDHDDFPDLIPAAVDFHNKLRVMNADTTLRIGPGRHFWDTWQQAIIPALEWLAPRLDATCSSQ